MFNNKKGQSLVEVIVALGIIVTGVIGSLALSVSALSSSKESETRIIAANLAREGVEVVRSIRDSNWLSGCPDISDEPELYDWDSDPTGCYSWDTGLKGEGLSPITAIAVFDSNTNMWSLDFTPDNIDHINTQFYRVAGVYHQNMSWPVDKTEVQFYRLITINDICQPNDLGLSEEIKSECVAGNENKVGVEVESHVKWTERGREHNLTARDRLYDWR